MKFGLLAATLAGTMAFTAPVYAADRTAELETIMEASQDDFQSVKGGLVSGETAVWQSTIAPTDMACEIEDATDQKGEDEWGPLFTFRIDNISYTVPYGVEPLAGP